MSDDAKLKDRFEYLNEQAKIAKERQEAFVASYHVNGPDLAKETNEAVLKRAEAERTSKFDPIELLKQIDQMRDEGVSEEVIRAAFNEAMNEARGAFRIPLRRHLRTSESIPVPPQEDINKMYFDRYKGIEDVPQHSDQVSVALLISEIQKSAQAREQLQSYLKNNKPTLKQRLFKLAYVLLRYPLQFLINFLIAFRQAKHDTSNQIYRR